jgi:cell division topological specificity factor
MSLLNFFQRRTSAPVARDRLQILLAHERVATGHAILSRSCARRSLR